MTRADLLALTPEVLATLTNRGLVNRAVRAVEGGDLPILGTGADGTVVADHPDGARSTLPPAGGLTAGACTCGAPGVCRHLLTLILAYQRPRPPTPPSTPLPTPPSPTPASRDLALGARSNAAIHPNGGPKVQDRRGSGSGSGSGSGEGEGEGGGGGVGWSPGEFSDEEVEEAVGGAAVAAARRSFRRGYPAIVRRSTRRDAVPQVELPSCTVRFLVPHQLGYAQTDAAEGRGEAVALAVWACRAADREQPARGEVQVQVGGSAVPDRPALDRAVGLAGEVLLAGAAHLGSGAVPALAAARRDLDTAGLCWPLLALDELVAQLDAYADRSARYRPALLAEVVAELHARRRAVRNGGASPAARVLGTEEPAEAPLRHLRLTGIGARVRELGGERIVEVFLAQPETGGVLVLRREWPATDDAPSTGHQLAGRRVAGSTLGALAAGNVVTESAVRSASRRIRFATARIARTTVTPGTGAWADLPATLLVDDLSALSASLAELPSRLVRPRVDAESVRLVRVAEVRSIRYAPGEQRLDAEVTDPTGAVATVSAVHRSVCPGALDSLAAALTGAYGTPRFVSGTVRRTADGLVVEPLAVVADSTVIVPDLAPGTGDGALATGLAPVPDRAGAALRDGLGLLAEAAHSGLRHLPATFPDRLRAAAVALATVGLDGGAARLDALAGALGPAPGAGAVAAWVDAQIRLLTTAECR
ncbi:hypothetical protein AB0D32_21525 [Micromonospora sp. NPDC048170]|uniref:hypothetical protein n=1 Tax=Micromonospora sp. NPDC048170 TaxID=3154819 RepID=UPI0033FD3399